MPPPGPARTPVAAVGAAHIPGRPVNTAYLTCVFDDDLIAHFHVNWLAPVKIRRSLIGGARQMIVYDDLEPSEKVKVYDKGVTLADGAPSANGTSQGKYDLLVGYRAGDMLAPQLTVTEALRVEAQAALALALRADSDVRDCWLFHCPAPGFCNTPTTGGVLHRCP